MNDTSAEKEFATELEFKMAWMVAKNHLGDWPNCVGVIESYIDGLKVELEKLQEGEK